MLKVASKFFLEKILPSVVATVTGAYIVNHYIVGRPVDAPAAATVAAAKAESATAVTRLPDGATLTGGSPGAGVRARGISEKAIESTPVARVIEKPEKPEKSVDRSADAGHDAAEPKRPSQAPRERAVARLTPADTASRSDERRDAADLARAAIERARGADRGVRQRHEASVDSETAHDGLHGPLHATPSRVQPLPPPLGISAKPVEVPNAEREASSDGEALMAQRLSPPADIPAFQRPLDDRASAATTDLQGHATIADDMLSAARSVFQAVLPR